MGIRVYKTLDLSDTLYVEELDETYHSRNGALQESVHVFIQAGLHEVAKSKKEISLLEIGFGTGLNAILTFAETESMNFKVRYQAIEAYPLDRETMTALNYPELISPDHVPYFGAMHKCEWNTETQLTENFSLHKHLGRLEDFIPDTKFDLVYFDAFAPDKQPELWTDAVFTMLYLAMNPGGVLVTYSSKGEVKRTLKRTGFEVQRLPGPPFKRHMLRAIKS